MIELMNHMAQVWWDWMSAMFWQVGLLIVLIAVIDLLIRKWAWPQLRYALWSLILIKLVLSPTLSLPSGLAPKLKPVITQLLESAADKELIEVTWTIVIPSADDDFRQTMVQSYSSQPSLIEPSHHEAEYNMEISTQENIEQEQSNGLIPDTRVLLAQAPDNVIVQPAGPQVNWRVYTMGTWLLGMITLGAWLFVKLNRLNKERTNGPEQLSLPESFYNQLDRCAQQLKLRRKPRVVITTRIQSPAVFGMFQPVLLMPVGYIRLLSRKDTEYMLLHELAHIKRGDLAAHSLCMLLRLFYWFNPLLWLVGRKLRHLRELCCDATVASLLRDKTAEYRQTLLETARRFLAAPVEPGLGLVGLFEDSNRLIARIQWLKKPVWRYRKMKNIVVFTAVLVLLACVIPMAQAQNPQPEDANVSTEKTEDQSSQINETVEVEQEQQQNQEQLQAMQLLKAKLRQLQAEQQKLQKELQAMMQAQQAKGEAAMGSMEMKLAKDMANKASMKAKEAKVKAEKLKADADMKKVDAEKRKAEAEMRKSDVEAKKWEQAAKLMEAQAQPYNAWVNSPEFQERIKQSADNWAVQWTQSDEFKKWQKEMQKWAQEQAKAHAKDKEGLAIPTPMPNPAPRPMPVMPVEVVVDTEVDVEPVEPGVNVDVEVVEPPEVVIPTPPVPPTNVPTSPEPLSVPVPTPPTPPKPPTVPAPVPPTPPTVSAVTPTVPKPGTPSPVAPPTSSSLPLLASSAETIERTPVLPRPKPKTDQREVKISKNKDGKFVATTEMHFVSKVKPGTPFIIRNNLGNITLLPSKDGTCEVKATICAKAKTAVKAKEMVEQVGMNIHSSEDRYYIKPVKTDGNKWNNLSVDFIIAVPTGIKPDIKTDLGSIELRNLKGQIKAMTDLGSVKAVNTTGKINLATDLGGIKFIAKDQAVGEIDLFTKMGDIELVAPKDLSARIEAENKMGSIKSDLPLKVNKIDMFKRKAEGTVGTGQGSIRMHTDMGSIHLKWQSVPEEVPVPKPSPSDTVEQKSTISESPF